VSELDDEPLMRLTISESMLEETELWSPVDDVVEPDRRLLSKELVRELVTLLTSDMGPPSFLQLLSEARSNNLSPSTHFFLIFFKMGSPAKSLSLIEKEENGARRFGSAAERRTDGGPQEQVRDLSNERKCWKRWSQGIRVLKGELILRNALGASLLSMVWIS
jgi:hypothetical protein